MRLPRLARFLFARLTPPKREPDFIIGDRYLLRWWMVRRNKLFDVYLHHIRHSDDARALHDHPWWSVSLCLAGAMIEHTPGGSREVRQGDVVLRSAKAAHRLEIPPYSMTGWGTGCWTLFITGPVIREWGFHCPQGWRPWREFVDTRDHGQSGRGCD